MKDKQNKMSSGSRSIASQPKSNKGVSQIPPSQMTPEEEEEEKVKKI